MSFFTNINDFFPKEFVTTIFCSEYGENKIIKLSKTVKHVKNVIRIQKNFTYVCRSRLN